MTSSFNQSGEFVQCGKLIVEVLRTPRRKTADIRVEDCAVSIVVPASLPLNDVESLLLQKKPWILHKLSLQRSAQPVGTKEYVSGECFPYLGRHYRLKIVDDAYEPTKLSKGRLLVTLPKDAQSEHTIRNALVRWYKKNARKKINERVERYATLLNVSPSGVDIKTYKARWGACSASGRVAFNWRIILAPSTVVDYVVLHELCHLIHFDHSQQFWRKLESVMPDYAERKAWLREHATQLQSV